MKTIFCFLFMMAIIPIHAEEAASVAAKPADDSLEFKKSNYQMNARYQAGAFLIYDCEGEYYACVDQDGSEKCRENRDASIKKKEKRYSCSPLKKFEDKKTCLQKNYEVIESLALKRFCYPK